MATIDITQQNFAEPLENNDIVFVDFWAVWCGPCRMFAPSIPTLMAFGTRPWSSPDPAPSMPPDWRKSSRK